MVLRRARASRGTLGKHTILCTSCCCCSLIVGIVSCALVLALVGSFRTTGGFSFVAEPALGNAVALCEREGVCDGPVVFEVLRPLPLEVLLEMLLLFTCMPLLFSADVFMSADIFSELPFGVIVETVVGTCHPPNHCAMTRREDGGGTQQVMRICIVIVATCCRCTDRGGRSGHLWNSRGRGRRPCVASR